jgi:transcription antitermination factor NusG
MPCDWFALKVRSKAEGLTEGALRGQSYETFLPTYTECRRYSDRIRKVQAPLFPGYLFCRLDPGQRLPILTTLGVQYIISFNGVPAPVDESELAALKRVAFSNNAAKPWPYLRTGDVARIEFGALAGLEGQLIGEKGSDFLVLSVSLLQRSVAVQIDRAWVRPIQTAGRTLAKSA